MAILVKFVNLVKNINLVGRPLNIHFVVQPCALVLDSNATVCIKTPHVTDVLTKPDVLSTNRNSKKFVARMAL